MEKIIKKLVIVGCGKLGQTIGNKLSDFPIEVIGIKRKLLKINPLFNLESVILSINRVYFIRILILGLELSNNIGLLEYQPIINRI